MSALATSPLDVGLHPGIDEQLYRSDPAISHSDLKNFAGSSPRPGRHLTIGSALHAVLLQPELAAKTYARAPKQWDLRTRKDRAEFFEFEEKTGKLAIRPNEYEKIQGMAAAVRRSSLAMEVLNAPGNNELAAVAELEDGYRSKSLIDIDREEGIWDLKTTSAPDLTWWSHSILDFGYDSAASYYERVYSKAAGKEKQFKGWIVVSKETFECWRFEFEDYHRKSGRRWCDLALRDLCNLKRHNLIF